MPTGGATVEIQTNAAPLAALVNRLAAMLANPEPQLERTQELLAAQEAAVWATEGAVLGAHWAALVEPWRGSGQPMVASGRLRDSLTRVGAGEVHGNDLVFGTDVFYARFHQDGTKRMAAREIVGIAPSFARAILNVFEDAVNAVTSEPVSGP